jgi:transcriptional regulator with XRE-family HTH domain
MEKSTHTPEYAVLLAMVLDLRTKAGLSQRDLAKRLEVPPSWVAKVECGERRLDVVELCWLIRACDGDAVTICGEVAGRILAGGLKRRRQGGK